MSSPTTRLRELGITLPSLSSPAGNYVHAVRSGHLLFLAGKGVGLYSGKVGRDVTVDQACDYARSTCIMLLSVIAHELGSLDKVARIVKVTGFVNAVPNFDEHPRVINGCSDLLIEVFGERGRHARTAIGAGSTPSQIPLEIEMVVEYADGHVTSRMHGKLLNMKTAIVFLALLLVLAGCSTAQNSPAMKPVGQVSPPGASSGQTAQKFHLERTQVLDADYLLFLPEGYGADSTKRWPLILFLHGAGERGSDVWLVAKHGPPKIDTTATNFPFIVVSPQCPSEQMWSDELVLALLDEIEAKHPVDTHHVYLTGLSMGGFGTWSLGMKHPERFAAIAPIAGGGETIPILLAKDFDHAQLARLKTLGVWAFHGGKDPTVPPDESERMVNALKKAGCKDVKLTIYPDAQHDSWTQTYANPELFEWFLQHSR